MSLVHLSNFGAHLKNCLRLNISTTSVPFSRLHLQVSYLLHKEGFISSIHKGSTHGPDKSPVEVTTSNISSRRLWLGLKYRNNHPVISKFEMISKPSRRVNLSNIEIKALASGIPVRFIDTLQPGECIFIKVGEEIIEVQEAAKRNLSGQVLCRVR